MLLLAGSDDASVRMEATHAGIDDFLPKPADPAVLEERIAVLLAAPRGRLTDLDAPYMRGTKA